MNGLVYVSEFGSGMVVDNIYEVCVEGLCKIGYCDFNFEGLCLVEKGGLLFNFWVV